MAWRHQATSHYLSLCWPRPMLPYGVIGTTTCVLEMANWEKQKSYSPFFLAMGIILNGRNILPHQESKEAVFLQIKFHACWPTCDIYQQTVEISWNLMCKKKGLLYHITQYWNLKCYGRHFATDILQSCLLKLECNMLPSIWWMIFIISPSKCFTNNCRS